MKTKTYQKPDIKIIEIRPEERLANLNSTQLFYSKVGYTGFEYDIQKNTNGTYTVHNFGTSFEGMYKKHTPSTNDLTSLGAIFTWMRRTLKELGIPF